MQVIAYREVAYVDRRSGHGRGYLLWAVGGHREASGLSHAQHTHSPFYRVDENEREALSELVPVEDWKSCICFPLADAEDVIAMLILASRKRHAFPSRSVGEILPLNSVAAMALAQHLYRAEKGRLEEEVKTVGAQATAALQGQFDVVEAERQTLSSTVEDQAKVIVDLVESMSHLDRDSMQYRDELQNLKTAIFALEEQSSAATEHLVDAYSEATMTSFQLTEAQTTNAFMRAVWMLSNASGPTRCAAFATTCGGML